MKNNKITMLTLLMGVVSVSVIAAEPHHDAHDVDARPVNAEPAAQSKPAFKKKKSRLSKAPVAKSKTAEAASTHQNPVQPAVSHAEVQTQPQSMLAVVSSRPRNRVATAGEPHLVAAPDAVHAKPDTKPEAQAEQATPLATQLATNSATTEPLSAVEIPENVPAIEAAATCKLPAKSEIAALFDRWNAALKTGDAKKVVANYATPSILLPTVSNQARFTAAEKEEYFVHFLQRKPEGKIDDRLIEVDCNSATDAGLYSFKFADGSVVKARYSFSYKKVDESWLISSHHSSAMPEKAAPEVNQQSQAAAVIAQEQNEVAPRNSSWIRFP